MRLQEIQKRLEDRLCNAPFPLEPFKGTTMDDDIEFLLYHCEQLTEMVKREQYWRLRYEAALKEFTDKHFRGGSKANRDDYVVIGVSSADVFKLWMALKEDAHEQPQTQPGPQRP